MLLEGKVAIVTGAASGIGAAACSRFCHEGATVIAVDLDVDGMVGSVTALPRTMSLGADISKPDRVDALFDHVLAEFKKIDVVLNTAGVDDVKVKDLIGEHMRSGTPFDITSKITNAQWDRMIGTNLTGAFYLVRASIRAMLPQRSGSIVLVSSLSGVAGTSGSPHYSASKAGILGLMRSVAKEVGDRGIRVNAITPGAVDTPMLRRAPIEQSKYLASTVGNIPLQRIGTPEEVAAVALFLASEDSSYVTGETVNVNGGVLTV